MFDRESGEACGVFGVFSTDPSVKERIPQMTKFALGALQHRGQEAAGIVISDGDKLHRHVGPGHVSEVFADPSSLRSLGHGPIGIGHVRYGTITTNNPEEAGGPVIREGFAIAHNGHWQSEVLEDVGITRDGRTDTERAADYIMSLCSGMEPMEATLSRALREIREGAFSLAVATPNQLFAVRDPHGFRPLVLGKLPGGYAVASETIAFGVNNIQPIREILPGEMLVIDRHGLRPTEPFGDIRDLRERLCAFEQGYFSAPASRLKDREVNTYRQDLGKALAQQDRDFILQAKPDMVIGVPDSGIPAAVGYAKESGIPYEIGMMKNRYQGRSFIANEGNDRAAIVRMKLTPYIDVVNGKSIVLIDDSIVRGTTTRELVRMMFEAGATAVHLRSTMPMYRYGCHMGMDTGDELQLIAARHDGDLRKISEEINPTTLGFLEVPAMIRVLGAHGVGLCTACMDGDYPIEIRSKSGVTPGSTVPVSMS